MTVPLTRATPLTPPAQLAFFGFARPPRPAKGDVGEPGKGAPQLAEIAARIAARRNRGGGAKRYARGGQSRRDCRSGTWSRRSRAVTPPARGAGEAARAGRGPNFVFSVAADGLLRGMIPDTGDLALAPARFVPANSTANGLIWTDGLVYAATSNGCGGAPTAVFAMDYLDEKKTVPTWQTDGATVVGLSLGTDGTVYASTGGGASQFSNSVVALDARTLKMKDWFKARISFHLDAGRVHRG